MSDSQVEGIAAVLTPLVIIAIFLVILGLIGMVGAAGIEMLGNVAARVQAVVGINKHGKHSAGGKHVAPTSEAEPINQPTGDMRGWEPEKVDPKTGEVTSFVWRGTPKE